MRILITGSNGQLGNELRTLAQFHKEFEFLYTDVAELDITDKSAVNNYFEANKPIDAVINCAAYTAVDKAESDILKARLINASAPGIIAAASKKHGAKLIHISTDFIFDGKKFTPYLENDRPRPLSIYAKTKLEGEKAVLKSVGDVTIVRTSWLYSSFGGNFVKTIIRAAREKGKLNVIFDQTGTPTYARDLADAIVQMLPKLREGRNIYHYSNEGVTSWYDFAVSICEFAGIDCSITPVETKDYKTAAKRPFYSVLNKARIKREFGLSIPYWRDSLKECIDLIKKQEK